MPKQFSVLNLPIHLLNDYTSWLMERLERRIGTHVVTLNAEMVMLTEKNPALAETIRQADLVIPDGAGIVIYLLLRGQKQKRCPGIELAESLLKQAGKLGESCPICFYGGAPGVTEKAAQIWRQRVPGLVTIANHGYLSPEQQEEWHDTLKEKQPRLIFVGLGVPRQEFWIRDRRYLCPESIWIGVGGSFDIWAGVKSRAPGWLKDNNLEWLYRLYKEPWRWRRMLALPQFMWRALFFSGK
jgi:N-acetylglucosaminyldiphosphoundecaprenol N-acetyl-beta-D-mannosaminyltransferase